MGAPFSLLCPTLSLFVPQIQEETNNSSESGASPANTTKQNVNEESRKTHKTGWDASLWQMVC